MGGGGKGGGGGGGGGGVDPPGPSTGSATAKPSENWLSN